MVHGTLLLWPLFLMVIAASIVLFGVIAIIVSIWGGTTVAILVKSKPMKKLLLIDFLLLLLIGVQGILPFVGMYTLIEPAAISIIRIILILLVGLLTAVGIKISIVLLYKVVKKPFIVLFCSFVCCRL